MFKRSRVKGMIASSLLLALCLQAALPLAWADPNPTPQEQIAKSKRLLDENPEDDTSWYEMAVGEARLGHWDRAIECQTKSIDLKEKKLRLNRSNYQNTQLINVNLGYSYQCRGNAYVMLRQYNRAISDLTRAIQINPSAYYNYTIRARAYELSGMPAQAARDRETAKSLSH